MKTSTRWQVAAFTLALLSTLLIFGFQSGSCSSARTGEPVPSPTVSIAPDSSSFSVVSVQYSQCTAESIIGRENAWTLGAFTVLFVPYAIYRSVRAARENS